MTFDVRGAYDDSAGAWAAGPAAIYRRLAWPLVEDCPVPIAGAAVLDFGAGSGATTDVLRAAGADVTAIDLSFAMLATNGRTRPPAVNADMLRLPFRHGVFDVAAGAFALSHVVTPVEALRELADVVRPGGAVMALGFDGGWEFAAKQAIEDVMSAFGFARPGWYETFKRDVEPLTSSVDRLLRIARAAGLADPVVRSHAIDTGVHTTDGIVEWRVGMPAYARFLAGLDDSRRTEVFDELRRAVGPDPDPLVPEVLVLAGRIASDR